jgi:hypothetical protein
MRAPRSHVVRSLAILIGALTVTSGLLAQNAPWPSAPASARATFGRFAGMYTLVDSDAKGYLAYDPSGYMGVSMEGAGRTRFAGRPKPEELRAALDSYTAYFGSFAVNDAAGTITHQTLGALQPRISGTDITSRFTLAGNRLTLRPTDAAAGARGTLTWERLPDLPTLTPQHRQLVGLWKLVSTERRTTAGALARSYPGWTGFIFYAPSGHMLVHMTEPYRRRPVGDIPTAEEAQAAYQNYTSYFGTYTFESPGSLMHHMEGSVNPGSAGTDTLRFFEFSGKNQLLLRPPGIKTPEGEVIMTNVWERVE